MSLAGSLLSTPRNGPTSRPVSAPVGGAAPPRGGSRHRAAAASDRSPRDAGGVSLFDATQCKNWQKAIEREEETLARLNAMLKAQQRHAARPAIAARANAPAHFPMPPCSLAKALSLLQSSPDAQQASARNFMRANDRWPQDLNEFTRSATPRQTSRRGGGARGGGDGYATTQPPWRGS